MENPAQKFKTLFLCTWNASRREVLQRFDSSENPGFARKPPCLSASQSTIGFSAKSRKRGVFRQNRKVATLPFFLAKSSFLLFIPLVAHRWGFWPERRKKADILLKRGH